MQSGGKEDVLGEPIHQEVRIGHAHLKVADLDRATAFYHDVLGFEIMDMGTEAAFLSAGGYHHHIGLTPGTAPAGRRLPLATPVCSM